jgi:Flp pilus assembly protein TadB
MNSPLEVLGSTAAREKFAPSLYNVQDSVAIAPPRELNGEKTMDQQPQPESSSRGTFLSLFLAAFFGVGFLLFLILLTGGFFLYVILAVVLIGLVGLVHYLLWGQALTQEVAAERANEEAKARLEAEQLSVQHPYGIRKLQ